MATFIHNPGNTIPGIDKLTAFVSVDPSNQCEAICGGMIPGFGNTPLVTASAKNVELFREVARRIGAATGAEIREVEFIRAGAGRKL